MSFFSVGLSIEFYHTKHIIDTFRASQPIPTPLNTFPGYEKMTPISGWPMTPASNHLVSCQHFHSLSAAFQAWQELINTSEVCL